MGFQEAGNMCYKISRQQDILGLPFTLIEETDKFKRLADPTGFVSRRAALLRVVVTAMSRFSATIIFFCKLYDRDKLCPCELRTRKGDHTFTLWKNTALMGLQFSTFSKLILYYDCFFFAPKIDLDLGGIYC